MFFSVRYLHSSAVSDWKEVCQSLLQTIMGWYCSVHGCVVGIILSAAFGFRLVVGSVEHLQNATANSTD
jgi:hypothetical protein